MGNVVGGGYPFVETSPRFGARTYHSTHRPCFSVRFSFVPPLPPHSSIHPRSLSHDTRRKTFLHTSTQGEVTKRNTKSKMSDNSSNSSSLLHQNRPRSLSPQQPCSQPLVRRSFTLLEQHEPGRVPSMSKRCPRELLSSITGKSPSIKS